MLHSSVRLTTQVIPYLLCTSVIGVFMLVALRKTMIIGKYACVFVCVCVRARACVHV